MPEDSTNQATADPVHSPCSAVLDQPYHSIARLEDMSPDGVLKLTRQRDGDIIVEVIEGKQDGGLDNEPGRRTQVEFCTYSGGGGSQRTLLALKNLMIAMAEDSLDQDRRGRTPARTDIPTTKFIAGWQQADSRR